MATLSVDHIHCENGDRATVVDGETIAHGLTESPTSVVLQTESANHAFPTRIGDETFTAAMVGIDGEPVDSPEPVHWQARVR